MACTYIAYSQMVVMLIQVRLTILNLMKQLLHVRLKTSRQSLQNRLVTRLIPMKRDVARKQFRGGVSFRGFLLDMVVFFYIIYFDNSNAFISGV